VNKIARWSEYQPIHGKRRFTREADTEKVAGAGQYLRPSPIDHPVLGGGLFIA